MNLQLSLDTAMAAHHLLYLLLTAALTVLTGRTLHTHGRPFLVDVFRGDARTADAVNNLLLVGFYLLNFAIAAWGVTCGGTVFTLVESLESIAFKVGVMLLILGGMHCVNVAVLCAIRRKKLAEPLDVLEFLDE